MVNSSKISYPRKSQKLQKKISKLKNIRIENQNFDKSQNWSYLKD